MRALRTDDVVAKAIASGYTTALSEAMKYLAAHAGYTRVHNPHTRRKTSCAFLVWWTSPTSTRPHAAGTRTCTSCSAEAASTRGHLFRAIVANDGHLMTAHGIAATTAYEVRSSRVPCAIDHRGAVIRLRAAEHEHWRVALAHSSTRCVRLVTAAWTGLRPTDARYVRNCNATKRHTEGTQTVYRLARCLLRVPLTMAQE